MSRTEKVIRSALLLILGILCVHSAFGCSFVDERAAMVKSLELSDSYWMASGVLGGVLISIEVYKKQWSFLLALTSFIPSFFEIKESTGA